MRTWVWGIAAAVVMVLAAACSAQQSSSGIPAAPSTVSADGTVTARIDAAAGGTVSSPSGAELSIPAHALSHDATATIKPGPDGVIDVHLDAAWSGSVRVGLPVASGDGAASLLAHYRDGAWQVENATADDGRLTASVDSLSPFKILKCFSDGEESIVKCLLKQGIKRLPSSIARKIGLTVTNTCGDVLDLSSWLSDGACRAGDPKGWQQHTPAASPSASAHQSPGGTPPGGSTGGSTGQGKPPAGAAPPTASVRLGRGPTAPSGYRYAISLNGFPAHHAVRVECYDSVTPSGFFTFTLTSDGSGNASTASACYSSDGPDHWATADGVESNHVTWTVTAPTSPAPATRAEQEGSHGVNTFTNYHNASGMGPRIAAGQWVQVSCKVHDPAIGSANPDGYWYRIASSPWNNAYYSPANTFMNGDPWGGPYSHNTDFAVPDC